MTIAIFGLGYVGTVSAACFAARRHRVIGVDVDTTKVDMIRRGRSPVIEPGLNELVRTGIRDGYLTATPDGAAAVRDSQMSLVCVGTPSRPNGSLNLDHVTRVTRQVAEALRDRRDYHVVAFRSTMLPGSVESHLLPMLAELSHRAPGAGFGVAVNPEFLREGSSITDFDHPPRTVIGELDEPSGAAVQELYRGISGPVVRTRLRTAELIKYADNCFHALKVAYANEIGNVCKRAGIDSHELFDIFCLDTKLNLSPAYLKSGFAFGGSCLPKDLRALIHHARSEDLQLPLIESILTSNELQKRIGLEMVLRTRRRKVGILGLSFKADTDDLRESPAVELTESLIGKGFDVAVYDKNVALARLVGANRTYIAAEIPHISTVLRDSLEQVMAHAEVLVVTRRDPEFLHVPSRLREDQILIDLVRLTVGPNGRGEYHGISW